MRILPGGRRPVMGANVASFGLTLANRGVLIGIVKAGDLLELAQEAEASGAFDAVWVGDSLPAKPRLESLTLLGAQARHLIKQTQPFRRLGGCWDLPEEGTLGVNGDDLHALALAR